MEVHFTPEKESQLYQLASRTGKDTSQVVAEAVDRLLEYDAQFLAAIDKGRESARRGNLIDHDEVVEQVEQMFRS